MITLAHIEPKERAALILMAIDELTLSKCIWMLRELVIIDDYESLSEVLDHVDTDLDELVIEPGRDLNLLHMAIKHEASGCLKLLVEKGMDINSLDSEGQSVLEAAILYNNSRALLKLSAYS